MLICSVPSLSGQTDSLGESSCWFYPLPGTTERWCWAMTLTPILGLVPCPLNCFKWWYPSPQRRILEKLISLYVTGKLTHKWRRRLLWVKCLQPSDLVLLLSEHLKLNLDVQCAGFQWTGSRTTSCSQICSSCFHGHGNRCWTCNGCYCPISA